MRSPLARSPGKSGEGAPLVLRYSLVGVWFGVGCGMAVGTVMLLIPVSRPNEGTFFAAVALFAFTSAAALWWTMSLRITIDDRGFTRRRAGRPAITLDWSDVISVATSLGESICIIGRDGTPTIRVSSSLERFPAFLDRLEARPEYDRWLRGEPDPDAAEVSPVFRRPAALVGLTLASAALWTLTIVYLLRPDLFAGMRADGPRGFLFNLVLIDYPALGQLLFGGIAATVTAITLLIWHTIRVEHDGLQLEAFARSRTIPFDDIVAMDLKIDRTLLGQRVHSFDHVLTLTLRDGKRVALARREEAKRIRNAIDRAMAAHRGPGSP